MTAGESSLHPGTRSTWLWVTAVYVGLTILYARPLLGALDTGLPHDVGDPALNSWIIWWNSQAWPLTDRWWNAPIFYPATGALALSETFLSVAPFTSPLQWLGASAVVTYNLTYLISFPLTGLAAHALARRLTGRHDAAFIAGVALAFSPWRTAQMPHLQMLLMWWMPLTLFALHRYLDLKRPRDLALAAVGWLMNGLTSGYFLVFFGVLVGVWALWFLRTRRDWIAVSAALLIGTLPMAPLLVRYKEIQSSHGLSRNPEEIAGFSADLTAVWATAVEVVAHRWTNEPRAEGELYPGLTIFLLAVAGGWTAWRAHRAGRWHRFRRVAFLVGLIFGGAVLILSARGGWKTSIAGLEISLNRPAKALFAGGLLVAAALLWDRRLRDVWQRRSRLFFYSACAILMLLFALGPTGRAFGTPFFYQAPYSWLMELPGGDALRVPARFGILFMLCLGQAAALAYSRLVPPGRMKALTMALVAAIFIEGWVPKFPVEPLPPTFDLEQMRPEVPLLELPIGSGYSEGAAMLRATRHKHVLFNGTSGYSPPHYDQMATGLQALDTSVLAALQSFGPLLVFVNAALDEGNRVRELLDQFPGAMQVGRSAAGTLYELPAQRTSPEAASDPELPIASITTSINPDKIPAMRDRQVTTRWETAGPQMEGDQVVVTLDRIATVSRVELDLGEFRNDYPRKLRVSVSSGGPEKTVWEGPTAGMAVTAILKDRVSAPLAIPFPAGTTAQRVTLSVVEGHKGFWWSVAELRVYGR
jgi:hypothetical protein